MKIRDICRDYPLLEAGKYQLPFIAIAERVQAEDLPIIIKYIDRFRMPNFTLTQENKTLWELCRYRCRFYEAQYPKESQLFKQLYETLYDDELNYFVDNHKTILAEVKKEEEEEQKKIQAAKEAKEAERWRRGRRYDDDDNFDPFDDGDDFGGGGLGRLGKLSRHIPSGKSLFTFSLIGIGLNLLSGSQQRRPANALLTLIPFAEFARNQYNRLFGSEAQNPHAVADDTFETMTTAGSMLAQSTIGVFIDTQIAQNPNILHTQLDVTRNNQREIRNNLTQMINDLRNGQYHIIVVRENLHFYTIVLSQNQDGNRRAMVFDSNSEPEVIDAHGTFTDILRQHFGNQLTIAAGRIQATNDCGFYAMMVADLIIHRGFSRTLQHLFENVLINNTPSFSHTLRMRYANLLFPHHMQPIKAEVIKNQQVIKQVEKEAKTKRHSVDNDGFKTPLPIHKLQNQSNQTNQPKRQSIPIKTTLREAMMSESKRKSVNQSNSNRQTMSAKKNRYSMGSNVLHMSDRVEEQDVLIRFHEHYERVLDLYNKQYEQGMIVKLLNQINSIESELTLKKLQQMDGSAHEKEMLTLKKKQQELKVQINSLRQEKEAAEDEQKALEQQRFDLLNELDELDLEKDKQISEYQARESEITDVIQRIQQEHRDLSDIKPPKKTQKQELEAELDVLEQEITAQMIEAESYLYTDNEGIPYNIQQRLNRIIDTYNDFKHDDNIKDLPEFAELIEDLKAKCKEHQEIGKQINGLKKEVKNEASRIYQQSTRKLKTIKTQESNLKTVKKKHQKHLEDHEAKVQILNDQIEAITTQIKEHNDRASKLQDKIHILAQSVEQITNNINTLMQLLSAPLHNKEEMLKAKLENDQARISHQIDLLSKYRNQLEETMKKYYRIYQQLAGQINSALTTRQLQTGGYRRQLNPTQVEEIEALITDMQRFIKRFEYYGNQLDK
jgi:hypothetical protein